MQGDIESLSSALSSDELGSAVDAVRVEADTRFNDLNDTLTAVATRVDAAEARLGEIDERIAGLGTRIDQGDDADRGARGAADCRPGDGQPGPALRGRGHAPGGRAGHRGRARAGRDHARRARRRRRSRRRPRSPRRSGVPRSSRPRRRSGRALPRPRPRPRRAPPRRGRRWPRSRPRSTQARPSPTPLRRSGLAPRCRRRSRPPPTAACRRSPRCARRIPTPPVRRSPPRAPPPPRARPAAASGAFLRTQMQARSLTPQEGSTPDAVLSRAEAALGGGDVAATLAELDALPAEGRAAMQGWIDEARIRADGGRCRRVPVPGHELRPPRCSPR